MGFFDFLTGGALKTIGQVVDDLHTSEEEKQAAVLKINQALQGAAAQYDREITKRWLSDNENIITRLVRPVSFSFVLVLFALVVLFDGNLFGFAVKESYVPVIEGLLQVMVIAYFGSRGIEKVTKTVKGQ
jgi:hypothetical protein